MGRWELKHFSLLLHALLEPPATLNEPVDSVTPEKCIALVLLGLWSSSLIDYVSEEYHTTVTMKSVGTAATDFVEECCVS
mmetsp:Transcript_74950/g.199846  ORF Transcript_74950/g.199846 Transcript_74950/m.199846 type:complete len:80 (+) Transcript_74950:933-1172(+)